MSPTPGLRAISLRRLLLLLLLVTMLAPSARADDPAEKQRARALLADGNSRYTDGDFRGALKLFRQAYDFYPSPKLLLNTAACEKAIGRVDRAASDLAEFLRASERDRRPSAEQRALVDRARIDLDVLSTDLGRIIVQGAGRDAFVEIDGEETWAVSYVKAGEHRVQVREPGQPFFETTVKVAENKTVQVKRSAAAEPLRPGPERVSPDRVSPTPTVAEPARDEGARLTEEVAHAPSKRRWVLPVAVVGGVVVLGLALGLGLGIGLSHRTPLTADIATVTFDPMNRPSAN